MDEDFNPSKDAFESDNLDDEETIEEEENLSESSDNSKEIEKLKQESEIPLDQLLMMYKVDRLKTNAKNDENNDENQFDEDEEDEYEDYDEDDEQEDDEEDGEEDKSCSNDEGENDDSYAHNNNATNDDNLKYYDNSPDKNLINNLMNNSHSLSEDDDCDFDPGFFQAKRIKIGDEYQVDISDKINSPLNPNDDDYGDLLWDPYKLNENIVVDYLKGIQTILNLNTLKEDETAFNILHKCKYEIDNAIETYKQLRENDQGAIRWSDEDNEAFEDGLKLYGKDFREIHENKLKKYSIAELVNYYYIWKKSERHDVFLSKFKIKKKYPLLNPSVTDFMERFMLDREQTLVQTLAPFISTPSINELSPKTDNNPKALNNTEILNNVDTLTQTAIN